MADRALWLSEICAANTEVVWASSGTTGFHNRQRNENRTWFYSTLRFLIVVESSEEQAVSNSTAGRVGRSVHSDGVSGIESSATNENHRWIGTSELQRH